MFKDWFNNYLSDYALCSSLHIPFLICLSMMDISTASMVVNKARNRKNVSITLPELMSETAAHVGSMS